MAATALTDINYQSETFQRTMAGEFTNVNALLSSGVMLEAPDEIIPQDSKGHIYSLPKWNTLTGDTDVITSALNTTINPLGDVKDTGVWLEREKAWGSEEMLTVIAGRDKDVTMEVAKQLGRYWALELHKIGIKVTTGAFANALSASHSTGNTYAAGTIDINSIVGAKRILGDNADYLRAMVMNSKVYFDAELEKMVNHDKAQAETFRTGDLGMVMGMIPFVTDQLEATAEVYPTYLATQAAMIYKFRNREKARLTNANQYRVSFGSIVIDLELNREAKVGGGQDELISRASFTVHIPGVKWNGTVESNPTNAQLATGANWTKVWNDDKLIRIVELKTK